MAGKARVHELAKEFGIESKTLLTWLKDHGEYVKSASSTIEPPVARRLREAFPAAESPSAAAPKAAVRPAATPTAGTVSAPAEAPAPVAPNTTVSTPAA